MHWIAGIMSSCLRYKIYTYVSCLKVIQLCHSSSLMVSYLLLLHWCTAIAGYQISNNNSNSQQQPTTGYRQTSKALPGVSLPTTVKTTTNRAYEWQFKYANTVPAVLCLNNTIYWESFMEENIREFCGFWNYQECFLLSFSIL